VFLAHHGRIPRLIDHVDGNSLNNHISNLREATSQQNQRNAKTRKTSTSGVKNVGWDKKRKLWAVRLYIYGRTLCFGHFSTLEEAAAVAEQARVNTFGEFARHA